MYILGEKKFCETPANFGQILAWGLNFGQAGDPVDHWHNEIYSN